MKMDKIDHCIKSFKNDESQNILLTDFVHFIPGLGTLGEKKKQDFPPRKLLNLAELGHFGSCWENPKKSGEIRNISPWEKKLFFSRLVFSQGKKNFFFPGNLNR